MKPLFNAAFLLGVGIGPSGLSAADTPQWRGPNRDGIFPDKALLKEWPKDGPKLVWKVGGLGRGLSSVSISDGKILTMGARKGGQWLIAIDVTTQQEV